MHDSGVSALVHKNRVELEGMLEDPLMTVVFTLLYELGEPISIKDRKVGVTAVVRTREIHCGVASGSGVM